MIRNKRTVAVLKRILAASLETFPRDFRRELGPSAEETLLERIDWAYQQDSWFALWRCFCRELLGILAIGIMERFLEFRTRKTFLRKRIRMKSTWLDLRQAFRRLRTSPGFSLTVLATLAVAIGATGTVFTLVNRILLQPLPYPNSQELVEMRHEAPGIGAMDLDQTRGTFFHYARNASSFASMALYVAQPANLITPDEPQRVNTLVATSSLFPLLGTPPLLGRFFTEEEGLPGGDSAAMLSHGLWVRSFGKDPSIIGKDIRVAGVRIRVVGVMPEGFVFPDAATDLWLPFQLDPDSPSFGGFSERAIGRLKPGISVEQAKAELDQLILALPEAYPRGFTAQQLEEIGLRAGLHPLKEYRVQSVSQVLWVLLGSVLLLLLIALLNVGNLFLVRAEGRTAEVAVRRALGAGSLDILRSFFTETSVVAMLGGFSGLILSYWGVHWLRLFGPSQLPRLEEVAVDAQTVTVCLLSSLVAACLLAGMSSIRRNLLSLAGALKDMGRGSAAGLRTGSQKVLVGAQVALALVLLISAGLMVRTLLQLQQVDPGFDTEGRLSFRISLPAVQYDDRQGAAQFHRQLLQELQSIPSVLSVGTSRCLPLTGWCGGDPIYPEGRVEQGVIPPVAVKAVSPDYLTSMGIRMVSGRSLTWQDLDSASGAAVISQEVARTRWAGEDPIGKRFRIGGGSEPIWGTVVGIAEDIRLSSLRDDPGRVVYFPLINPSGMRQLSIHDMTYVVRSAGDPMNLLPVVRSRLAALNPELPMADIRTLDQLFETATADASFAALLLFISALAANLMGALGLYGALSYLVTRRTNEIGVRMVLGARVRDVGWMIVKEAGTVVVAGITLGLFISLGTSRLISSALFRVSPTDPGTCVLVTVLLLLIGALAAAFPARRAARLEPARALRWE